jgi:flagellar export protein FliJ
MKPFKFSLQALLTLREQQEQKALLAYGKALLERDQAMNKLRAAQKELEEGWAQLQEKLLSHAPAATLTRLQDYCQAVQTRQQECEQLAQASRNKADQCLVKLLAARQARDVLDRFCGQQKARYQRQRRRQEQKALDELSRRRNALALALHLSRGTGWN